MRVIVFEDNLLWSSRLVKSLKALGHESLLRTKLPDEIVKADVAIVNLGSATIPAAELIPKLKGWGIHVIGHAGHKETELIQFGKDAGCDTLATNSQITFKLAELLDSVRFCRNE